MTNIALYTRISDKDKQGDNFSIASQLAAMRQFADEQRMTIVAEFVEKESASQYGEGLDRTELARARKLAREGVIDALVFFDMDRFTRDMGDGIILRRELYRLRVKLICYYPYPHEITSDQEIVHVLTDWRNQEYIDSLREKSMRGYKQKALDGLFSQGKPPYGYKLVGRKKEAQLVINEDEAKIVRLIFQWCVEHNLSTVAIARKLTEAGVATPGTPQKRRECQWAQARVYRILTNETYAGTWYAHRYKTINKNKKAERPREEWIPVAVPALVDREMWEQAGERLKARDHERRSEKPGSRHSIKHEYLLSRRVQCGKCGFHMIGDARKNANGTIRTYYKCNSRNGANGLCGMPHFRADLAEAIVWRFLRELARNPQALLKGYQQAQQETNELHTVAHQQIDLLDEQLTEYTEKLTDTLDHRAKAKAPALREVLDQRAEEYAQIIGELQHKRTKLVAQLADDMITDEHIHSIVTSFQEVFDQIDYIEETNDLAAKRALVEALNLHFTLRLDTIGDGEKWIDIHWLNRVYSQRVSKQAEGKPFVCLTALRSIIQIVLGHRAACVGIS